MWYRFAVLMLLTGGLFAEKIHLIVKGSRGVSERSLAAQGFRALEPLGDGEWIVSVDSASPLARLGKPLETEQKLHESLRGDEVPIWARVKMRGEEGAEVLVYFHKDVSADEAQWEMDRIGAQVVERSDYFERLTVKVRLDDLKRVAAMDWVKVVEPVFGPYRLANNSDSAALIKVKELQEQFAMDGAGATVAIVDDPVATHPEFGDRLLQTQTIAGRDHGTHVAGTVAAAGSTDPRLKGMAPAARLVSMPFNTVSAGISANLNSKQLHSADLAQNSWLISVSEGLNSCSVLGDYLSFDRELDRIVYQEKFPIVFSAGNERDLSQCLVSARGGFYSAPSPGAAKNIMTVGAVDIGNAISGFSSFGPARDGRLKPDVVALGVGVLSTATRNATRSLSGTSMSAPAVSGLSALLINRHRGKHGKAPAPELLRAMILNTANDLGNPGPDYSYGYGIPDGVKALKIVDDDHWNTGSVLSGETKEFEFELPAGQPALRVMLAWSDPPAPAGRTRQLMNNLDLRLISPDGRTLLPFVLNPQKPEADAVAGENVLDNVEQVAVAQPAAGKWKIVVNAKDLAVGPQDYAFVWSTAENPAPPCSATVTPETIEISDKAATVAILVARSSVCEAWSAGPGNDWIRFGEPTNPKASGLVKVQIAANQTGASRRSTVLVAGRSVVIRQNTSCVAQPITSGVEVAAELTTNDCLFEGLPAQYYTKVYTFQADAGQRVTINAASRAVDTFIYLYGPGNIFLAADDDSGGGSNSRIPVSGALTLPIKGTYRILMTSFDPGQTGPFTLNMQLQASVTDPAALPKVITACPATVDGELITASSKSGRRGDFYNSDLYLFEGRAGQQLNARIAEAGFDGVMYLIAPSGATVAFEDDTEGSQPRIQTTLLANGVYRLDVSSFSPFTTGRYKLEVTGCSEWSNR
ncbi:MAG: hypothetical protein FJW36_01700 [Acidobacteria bacterium]|nr:hypothetical protein [Acidobacteriota bacterium]